MVQKHTIKIQGELVEEEGQPECRDLGSASWTVLSI